MSKPTDKLSSGDALLVVDVQNDFCPGGAVPVENGDKIVPTLNRWVKAAEELRIPVFISRDWHPAGHPSFKDKGGKWPPHCVQDTEGAEFHPDLALPEDAVKVTKGVRFDKDQYSAFDETGLDRELRSHRVERIVVGGLAQDVCIRATVLDGLKAGFEAAVIAEATRPVTKANGEKAMDEMREAGAEIIV